MSQIKISLIVVALFLALFFAVNYFGNFEIFSNAASVLGSQQNERYMQCIRNFSDKEKDSFLIQKTDINTDNMVDAIVQYTDAKQCGTAGCVVELCVSSQAGIYTHIPFGYAVKTIRTTPTISNGMHDLILDDDITTRMTWNGTYYALD